jgi:hypothetical protein
MDRCRRQLRRQQPSCFGTVDPRAAVNPGSALKKTTFRAAHGVHVGDPNRRAFRGAARLVEPAVSIASPPLPGDPMTIQHNYTYASALDAAVRVHWRVEDVVGNGKTLDFTKPFLPDALAGVSGIASLSESEKLVLNQIRGATYLHLFQLVEEFILPYAHRHAGDDIHGDKARVRAWLTFAEEEAKHQVLFHRFAEEFEKGLPTKPEFIGPATAIARAVLGHSELGVALLVLHLEWLTQRHYLESVKTDESLDPLFVSLLRHHWQEEAQHAKLDTLVAAELASQSTPLQIEQAIDDFLKIGGILDGGLQQQVQFDIGTLERAIGRPLTTAQRQEVESAQLKSYRFTFLVSGLEQPNFTRAIADLSPSGLTRIAQTARALS